ncbi:transcription initiation factor TFIID [Paenibacillus glucanolyticus]|uniref:transcription initiation factor TFIID n=1 Tax=Paenibacillus glucanolyticus TaxID=59843 RepID=UPI00128D7A41|nr:transcription initiation factor TFIID [Paenibacillus glucanolyticus]MPY19810.1 transcription initiation factor TFIID [Paenibacillus glucanolyticus]
MREILRQYAAGYAKSEEQLTLMEDDQSSIHYPEVYLFIGDMTAAAIEPIMEIHDRKWDNSASVIYFHVGTDRGGRPGPKGSESSNRLHSYQLDLPVADGASKSLRKELYQAFYQERGPLSGLNKAIRKLSHHISDYGRSYSSFDRVHLSIITRVDDPFNVFIPEISLLAESIFNQSFKSVQMDLYALINEREQIETYGYASSVGVAFLRELELMQSRDYSFSAPLQMTEDGLSIPVVHPASPLFDLVYVLSDKNERGISGYSGMQDIYDIICHLGLLKNRKQKDEAYDGMRGVYNNTSFKSNIMTESGRQGFVSAGFARVKRPNEPIALTVLYHLCRGLLQRMKTGPEPEVQECLTYFGLDPEAVTARANRMLPNVEHLDGLKGMMSHPVSYAGLKRMNIREAEEALFGEGCQQFFHSNYELEVQKRLGDTSTAEEVHAALRRSLSTHPHIGCYQIVEWTSDKGGAGILLEAVRSRIRDLGSLLKTEQEELTRYYEESVETQPFKKLPFRDKQNVRQFIRFFVGEVYHRRYELLLLETELALYRLYEAELEQIHRHYKQQASMLDQLEAELLEAAQSSIRTADDYIGQNLMEYYGLVTEELMLELESKRGAAVFFEDRYVGNLSVLTHEGTEPILANMIRVCLRDLLTAEPFVQTFEEELLRRANVTIEYHNKQVLAKEDLFKVLYQMLEENSVTLVRLLDYTQEHRYEEKYFFGDADSEFVRYAIRADEALRVYKLGIVHEKRSSGVEKLNLMGGFHLEDLMYYRNGRAYYETYTANGYEFHGMEPALLPELR